MSQHIHLTQDQQFLINMYIQQYNQAQTQINNLHQTCNNIRRLITNIYTQSYEQIQEQIRDPIQEPIQEPPPTTDITVNDILNLISLIRHENGLTNRRLTNEEILNRTSIQLFSEIVNPINIECPIRLEEFQPTDSVTQIRGCGHIFNSQEIQNWFINSSRCPVCRRDILLAEEIAVRAAVETRTTARTDLFDSIIHLINTSPTIDSSGNMIVFDIYTQI